MGLDSGVIIVSQARRVHQAQAGASVSSKTKEGMLDEAT